jgi:CDP-glycerol glycerophosphotransferase (TagB/SpsB family)
LVSTAFYCDIVVNVGSTMAFDFAMFQKPCIFINYDQKRKENPNWSVETIYQFQHFKSMSNNDAVLWWNEKGMITELLKQSFNKQAMNHWKERVLSTNLKNSSTTIRKSLNL